PKLKVVVIVTSCWLLVGVVLIGMLDFSNIETRMQNILNYGLTDDESIDVRYAVSSVSVASWLSNPLFGIGLVGWSEESYDFVGLHSSIIDVPAQLGLVGFWGYFGFAIFPLWRAVWSLRDR